MSMDSTVQVRMDSKLKSQVEELYKKLGTSFAEAVRIFAQQSVREGGMPFTPRLVTLDTMSEASLNEKLVNSVKEAEAGEVLTQEELDALMEEKLNSAGREAV